MLGVPLQNMHRTEIVEVVVDAIRKRQRKYRVVHANAHLVTLARGRPWLRELFARAEVAFCDGAGVQVASLVLNNLLLHRTTPPEWIEDVGRAIALHDGSVFWLGGAPDIVANAAAEFSRRTNARTAGYHHGFFDSSAGSRENDAVIEMINAARPDLLIVNMGMPLQEWWISHFWDRLDVCVVMTAGALVDHLAGRVRRPPRWVSNAGLEWAVRLIVEPRRLWRRYLLGLRVLASQSCLNC